MVNNLTLSKIIQLNSGVKDVPYNVFFSTKQCKDVINHKCIPHEPVFSPDVEAKLKTLKNKGETLEKELSDAKQRHKTRTKKLKTKNAKLSALSGLLGAVLFVIAVVIVVMFCRRDGKFSRDQSSLTKSKYGMVRSASDMMSLAVRRDSNASDSSRYTVNQIVSLRRDSSDSDHSLRYMVNHQASRDLGSTG